VKHVYRCWAEVDLAALRENLLWIRHRVGDSVKIMTVVKADAYGHGLKQIAALLMQSGTDVFGVANLAEAMGIRSVGRGWPVVMLGACLPDEIEAAVRDDITPTISSFAEAERISTAAGKLRKIAAIQVKVDTGMGRLGVLPGNAIKLLRAIQSLPNLTLQGLYTHFASVEDNAHFSGKQRRTFLRVVNAARRAGISIPLIHANNSGGLLHEPSTIFNMVRPGLLVYGVVPPGERDPDGVLRENLRPAMAFKTRVALVREIQKNTPVSYGGTFIAPRRMRIAVLAAGYGDGFPRAGSNRAEVLLHGRRCRVLGRITMDQTIVDASETPVLQPGDEAVFFGKQNGNEIRASELASWCGTIPWEILTTITYRVPRVYLGASAS
jgi:alanine racemase